MASDFRTTQNTMTTFSIGFHYFWGGLILFSKSWEFSSHLRLTIPTILSLATIIIYFYIDRNASVSAYEFGMFIGPFITGLIVFLSDILSKRLVGRQFYLRAGFSKHYNLPGFVGDNDHLNLLDNAVSLILIFSWGLWPIIFETIISKIASR